ncbi:MAG: DUF6265 family protein [Pyrinomonadaceae bacterium]
MRNAICCIIVCVIFCGSDLYSQTKDPSVEDLAWLAGCWEQYDHAKRSRVSENWMKPDGGLMLGTARSVRNGAVVNFEFMRIEKRREGTFYVAKTSQNKDEIAFRLVSRARLEATFENPAHDFPQRITYRLDGDILRARVEGLNKDKPSALNYELKSVACR